ncbi:MAG: DUF5343 domain-containing protein [Gemmatimonadaceae bacterium]
MAIYPYASNPARVKQFFQTIQSVGVPPKLTTVFLESIGFKSKNDRAIIPIVRAVGFVDASGAPTEHWRNYRNKERSRALMAEGVRSAYRDLFTTFPDAQQRDNDVLRNFFSTHSSVGEGGLRFIVGTFKALTELGDFDSNSSSENRPDESSSSGSGAVRPGYSGQEHGARKTRALPAEFGGSVTLNINIQLQIPDTKNPETYENLFASIKRHLLS